MATGDDKTGSLHLKARIAGLAFLVTLVAGALAEDVVRASMMVTGDAGATAAKIMANETLYRMGAASDLVMLIAYTVVTALFCELFAPISRGLSRVAAAFGMVGLAVAALGVLDHLTPLVLLGGRGYLNAFTAGQLQAMAYTALRLHSLGYHISIVFFACQLMLVGYLVMRSSFLPRVLGLILGFGGLCYLANSFANILSPSLANAVSPYLLLPGGLAELLLGLWLTLAGLNAAKWREQAAGET